MHLIQLVAGLVATGLLLYIRIVMPDLMTITAILVALGWVLSKVRAKRSALHG